MSDYHPSYFALDRAALGDGDPSLATHLESCERCRAHVETVNRRPAIPAWLPEGRTRRIRWPFLLAPALALVALLFLLPPIDHGYVGGKAVPSMRIFVKRGEHVFVWEGKPVHEGDSVRIGVTPLSHRHVTVFSKEERRWSQLYRGEVDGSTESLLPASWRIDESLEPERLLVVLSEEPLPESIDPSEAQGAAVFEVSLPKEAVDEN